tara:strand:- start:282 stop:446 length:165 start_codon:yes stop_codon:yes gene_type:complete
MRKLISLVLAFGLFSATSAFAYDKIEWTKMDKNKDGYISPKEMKDHYTKEGVYK